MQKETPRTPLVLAHLQQAVDEAHLALQVVLEQRQRYYQTLG